MSRLSKDSYFIQLLDLVCARSTCLRRSVGAILVDAAGHILATGYNGPPAGFTYCTHETPCPGINDLPGDSRRCLAVHAEQNALLQCLRLDLAHTLYVSCCPCFTCAKMVLNTNLQRVVAVVPYAKDGGQDLLLRAGRLYFYDFESNTAQLYTS